MMFAFTTQWLNPSIRLAALLFAATTIGALLGPGVASGSQLGQLARRLREFLRLTPSASAGSVGVRIAPARGRRRRSAGGS